MLLLYTTALGGWNGGIGAKVEVIVIFTRTAAVRSAG